MICPACGAETQGAKFCENCGSPLPAQSYAPQDLTSDTYQPQQAVYTPPADDPAAPSYQQAAPYQADPYQSASYQADPYQSSYQAAPYQTPTASATKAPNAAFVLSIVGLVLSVFALFIPGIICSIIGLVLNAGYNKKGLDNPRKTPTMVLGIVGIVIGILVAVTLVFIGVVAMQVVEEADRQGINITESGVHITEDSSGNITISTSESSNSASSGTTGAAAGILSSGSASEYSDAKYHDSNNNPTLYSMVELSGSQLQDLLTSCNYKWYDTLNVWRKGGGSFFGIADNSGDMESDAIASLPVGASGQPVAYLAVVDGYSSPKDAFDALSSSVSVEERNDVGDSGVVAIVYGSNMERKLVFATNYKDDTSKQSIVIFNDASISSGLLESLVGTNTGSSVKEVYDSLNSA